MRLKNSVVYVGMFVWYVPYFLESVHDMLSFI